MPALYTQKLFKDSKIGKIPSDWECLTLEQIAEINPKPIKLESDEIVVSFVGMADVSESAQLIATTNKAYGDVKKGFTSFCDYDVLVAKITPCFENGKGALASNLTNGVGFGSTEFHVLRAKPSIGCPSFIHHITTSHNFRAKGEMNMTGTAGQKRVGKDFIAKYPIACPPLPEQQKIAGVLSTVDKKINLIDQKIVETQKLKTGLMQKLFSEGIGIQDKDGNWQPHTEFKEINGSKIPITWNKRKLGSLLEKIVGGGTPSKSKPEYWGGNIPWASVKDFKSAILSASTINDTITDAGVKNSATNLIEPDTVVVPTRMALGKVAMTADTIAINQDLKALYPVEQFDNKFLFYWLETQASKIESLGSGSTVAGIRLEILRALDCLYPESKDEQKEIAQICSTVDSKLSLLKQQKTETQQLKKGLMQKLLTGEWRVPLDETEAA